MRFKRQLDPEKDIHILSLANTFTNRQLAAMLLQARGEIEQLKEKLDKGAA